MILKRVSFFRTCCIITQLIPALSVIVLFSISFLTKFLPPWTFEERLKQISDACELLRGMSSSAEREAGCRKRICIDVLSDSVYGKWRPRSDITEDDVKYRKRMDAEIRLRMKEPWPASLYRNDSRFTFVY